MRSKLVIMVLFLLVASECWLRAQAPQPFTADFSAAPSGAKEKTTGKFYFSSPKLRLDVSSKGQDVVLITDSSTQISTILMPRQQMYMETLANQSSPSIAQLPDGVVDPSNPCSMQPDTHCKKIGAESIHGRDCDKWEITDKKSGVSTMWLDRKLHFPIKTKGPDGAFVEFTNIKEVKPEASLFEIPAGYKKMDLGITTGTRSH